MNSPPLKPTDRTQMQQWGRQVGINAMRNPNSLYMPGRFLAYATEYLALAASDDERQSLYFDFYEGLRNTPEIWQAMIDNILFALRDRTNFRLTQQGLPTLDWNGYR